MKLHKFQTIITEDKMETLKNVLYKQYNEIEPYIYESSILIKDNIENFTRLIIDSSDIFPIISNNIYEKLFIYYDMFSDTIQNKYNIIGIKQFRQLQDELADKIYIFGKSITQINNYLEKADKYLWEKENQVKEYFTNVYESIKNKFKKDKNNNGENTGNNQEVGENENKVNAFKEGLKAIKSIIDKDYIDYRKPLVDMPLPFFPLLHLKVIPFISLGHHLDTKMLTNDRIGISLDMHIRGQVGINLDVGIYVPKGQAPVQMSVSCGINGILVSGRAGIKISFYLVEEIYETDLYYMLSAFSFNFYVKFNIIFKVWRIKYNFEFYLINYIYTAIHYEKHKIKAHELKLFNINKKLALLDHIKKLIGKENMSILN